MADAEAPEDPLAAWRAARGRVGAKAAGKVKGTAGAAQHVDLYKKELLRDRLLRSAVPGAAYVPFCGEGDLAVRHYSDRVVFGADLDAGRVATARSRLPESTWVVGDCDAWPFGQPPARPYIVGRTPRPPTVEPEPIELPTFAVADLDSYSYPYHAFRAFWDNAPKADTLVIFFTDGQRQGIFRNGTWREPDGTRVHTDDLGEKRKVGNAWWTKHLRPWLVDAVSPEWSVTKTAFYMRQWMLYWGTVLERVDEARAGRGDALTEGGATP